MAEYIFQEGKCAKSELFGKIVDLMINAGWQNISSNPTTDFVVLNSKGESNDKDLFIQLRGASITNTNNVETTLYGACSYRLIAGYTPNANSGTAGTFARSSEGWKVAYLAPSSTANLPLDLQMTYRYHVNKNRLIIIIETPEAMTLMPVMWYFGLPMETYTPEPNSRGVIAATSYSASQAGIHITDAVAEMPSLSASTTKTVYCALPPKSPNSSMIHTPVEMLYGDASEGYRGKIDGIYFLPTNSINDGDYLNLGSKRFRATQLATSGNNAFPSANVIYQVN